MKVEFTDFYIQLGRNVAYYRKLKGYTQAELAELLDCETSFIGQIEAPNIVKSMSLDTLLKICEVLHTPPSDLLTFRDWNKYAEGKDPFPTLH